MNKKSSIGKRLAAQVVFPYTVRTTHLQSYKKSRKCAKKLITILKNYILL